MKRKSITILLRNQCPTHRSVQGGQGQFFVSSKAKKERLDFCVDLEVALSDVLCERPLFKGAVYLISFFGLPLPEYKKKKGVAIEDIDHITKPDLSNMSYFLENRLEGVLIENDRCIQGSLFKKFYSRLPYIIISVGLSREIDLLDLYEQTIEEKRRYNELFV